MMKLATLGFLVFAGYAGWTHFAHSAGLGTATAAGQGNPIELVGPDLFDGHTVSLSGFAPGRPVVVNIWASYCGACNDEAPQVKAFVDAHPGAFFSLDTNEPASAGQSGLARWGYKPLASVSDPGRWIGSSPGVDCSGLPCTLFLDANHRVTNRIVGAAQPGEIEHDYLAAGGS